MTVQRIDRSFLRIFSNYALLPHPVIVKTTRMRKSSFENQNSVYSLLTFVFPIYHRDLIIIQNSTKKRGNFLSASLRHLCLSFALISYYFSNNLFLMSIPMSRLLITSSLVIACRVLFDTFNVHPF